MPEQKPCPAHRSGLKVMVTERRNRGVPCHREVYCSLQSGHPGECESADND